MLAVPIECEFVALVGICLGVRCENSRSDDIGNIYTGIIESIRDGLQNLSGLFPHNSAHRFALRIHSDNAAEMDVGDSLGLYRPMKNLLVAGQIPTRD